MNATTPAWQFKTRNFTIALYVDIDWDFQYDGEDEDGSIQRQLNSCELVAFDSRIKVQTQGCIIGVNFLGGSVYKPNRMSDFWTAHRSSDPMQRNCSIMRAANGGNVSIGHYFPDMVREATKEARQTLANMPRVRGAK